jgi:hypothetical protein
MANLKDKLAQQVEVLNSASEDEQTNNVIVLNPSKNTQALSVLPDFAISIAQAKERIALLQNFVKEMMQPNIDYGLIPGCQKPSLYKSGAEKLCDVYGFSKQLEVTNRIEDWEHGIFAYEVKMILISKRTGQIEAEGIGSCNSRERKYKNQDGFTLCNTILKMAKKRALIDAVLSATRSSGIFTQDVVDMDLGADKVKREPDVTINQVYALAKKSNIPTDFIKKILRERYNVTSSTALSPLQVQDLYEYLRKQIGK